MKEQDVKLTLQETEQLCRLYMDCRLTVLEETELQYVLGKLPYSSPCIDEVRILMGLTVKPRSNKSGNKKFGFIRNRTALSIAASFTVLMVVAVALFNNRAMTEQNDTGVYIAYANGTKVDHKQTIQQVKADMKTAEVFLNHIAELEAQEQKMVDNFMNQISSEQ